MNESNNKVLAKGEIERLKTEFDQLQTIEQKYNYRKKMLKLCYEGYDISSASLSGFEFEANTAEEIEQLNRLRYADFINGSSGNNVRNPEKWKEIFLKKIETAKSKEVVVFYELEKINNLMEKNYTPPSLHRKELASVSYLNKDENFYNGYENYIPNGDEDIDWSEKKYEPNEIASILNGIEWAKYKKFVEDYLIPKKKKNELKFSHDIQVLILDYMGFDRNLGNNTEKGKYYAPLLNRDSEITRQKISSIEKHRTKENLEKILTYLKYLGFMKQADQVKKDLDKLN